jgi:histone arginine demethylase JMJD6
MVPFLRAEAIRVLSRPSAIDYNEPCIIKNAIAHWPALREHKWHPRRLQALYGERLFERGLCAHNDEPLLTSLNRFFRRKHPRTRRRCYVFDSTFDADCPELLDDYNIPAIFQFGSQLSPTCHPAPCANHSNRWWLVGHAGSGSPLHADPVTTSAWNALVFGTKEWVVVQPEQTEDHSLPMNHLSLPSVRCSGHEHYKRMREVAASTPLHRWFSKHVPWLWRHAKCVASFIRNRDVNHTIGASSSAIPRMMRFTQRPGDIVYVPSGWQHAVLNTSLSVAVTHNFISPTAAVLKGIIGGGNKDGIA